jgi:hypothetical protein
MRSDQPQKCTKGAEEEPSDSVNSITGFSFVRFVPLGG